MKKIRLNIAILATLVAVIFSSCDKDVESTAVTLSLNDTAILTLYVFADLDLTDAGMEAAPAGTQLYVKINYGDYKAGVGGAYIETITTDASGMATLRVPADDDGITVRVTPLPFNYEQVQVFNSYEPTVNKIYSASTVNISVSAGESKVQQIDYDAPDSFSDFTPMTEISGKVFAELTDVTAGEELVPNAITLTFHTSDWSVNVQPQSSEYTVEVPAGTNVYVTCKFQATRTISSNNNTYEFEKSEEFVGNFSIVTDGVDLSFGGGIEVE